MRTTSDDDGNAVSWALYSSVFSYRGCIPSCIYPSTCYRCGMSGDYVLHFFLYYFTVKKPAYTSASVASITQNTILTHWRRRVLHASAVCLVSQTCPFLCEGVYHASRKPLLFASKFSAHVAASSGPRPTRLIGACAEILSMLAAAHSRVQGAFVLL